MSQVSYDPRSYGRNFCNCIEKPEKVRTSTRFEPCDLAISVGCSNQLSYEATDIGSWSCVGPNVPVRDEPMTKLYMK